MRAIVSDTRTHDRIRPEAACSVLEKRTFADFAVRPEADLGDRPVSCPTDSIARTGIEPSGALAFAKSLSG